uniref:Uncharacterized protein n=1 Tax=Rhizophora mucronata TaxID=61149 RepID=A0A2P2JNU3_RHIMU
MDRQILQYFSSVICNDRCHTYCVSSRDKKPFCFLVCWFQELNPNCQD